MMHVDGETGTSASHSKGPDAPKYPVQVSPRDDEARLSQRDPSGGLPPYINLQPLT